MGIDALAVGDQDLKLGVEFLQGLAAARGLPMLCANLTGNDGKTVFPPRMTKRFGGLTVGIFAVLTPTGPDGAPVLPSENPRYKIGDPFDAARREIAALKAEGASLVIALTHLGLQEDLRLANEIAGIHLIVGGHSMSQLLDPQRAGSTWIVQSGHRGKQLGHLEIDLRGPMPQALEQIVDLSNVERVKGRIETYQDRITEISQRVETEGDKDRKVMLEDQLVFYKEQLEIERKNLPADGDDASRLSNRLVDLNRDLPDHPKVAVMVAEALEKMSALPVSVPTPDGAPGPSEGPFVGAVVCQACHTSESKSWMETGHARAYKTLVDERHALDFDCVGCHTTGYRQPGGPSDPFTIAGLTGVQCEACHGPGRAHAASPKKVKLKSAFDEAFCRSCHSAEQTGDRFDFASYLPKVDHGVSAKRRAAKAPGAKP